MASQTTCICCVEMPRPFRNERAALAPSTSKRFSAVYRSVKPRSCRIVATANNSGSGARSAPSESNTPNSQERIAWLKRNGSDAIRDKSIASRTRTVSGTLIPAKTILYLSRFHIVRGRRLAFCSAVRIVGSEELLGGRYVVFGVPFHLYAPLGSLLSGILCPSIQTTG